MQRMWWECGDDKLIIVMCCRQGERYNFQELFKYILLNRQFLSETEEGDQ